MCWDRLRTRIDLQVPLAQLVARMLPGRTIGDAAKRQKHDCGLVSKSMVHARSLMQIRGAHSLWRKHIFRIFGVFDP